MSAPTKRTPEQVMAALTDPDMVGTVAYRAVHEAVESAVACTHPADDALAVAMTEAREVAAAAFEAYRTLQGLVGPDPVDQARKLVTPVVRDIFLAELANEEAMRREAMSKQRQDELPPAATLSSVIDSVQQGLPIGNSPGDEIDALTNLLAIRDLLPGGFYISNLLNSPLRGQQSDPQNITWASENGLLPLSDGSLGQPGCDCGMADAVAKIGTEYICKSEAQARGLTLPTTEENA